MPGERIRVEGMALDGTGAPVTDVLLEVWQADAAGISPHPEDPCAAQVAPGFRGWGGTDFDTGLLGFGTICHGPVSGRIGRVQAPHLNRWIVARSINIGLNARMHFPEDADLRGSDPVLGLIEQRWRVAPLVAETVGPGQYRLDIRLQGEAENVLLDIWHHERPRHHLRGHTPPCRPRRIILPCRS